MRSKRFLFIGVGLMTMSILVLSCIRCAAQDRPAPRSAWSATLRDPLLWLNVGGESLAVGTTHAFLTGHGQSVSHPGPCVEGNAHWGGTLTPKQAWANGAINVGIMTGVIYIGHRFDHVDTRVGKTIRWITKGAALGGGIVSTVDGIHNVAHCGLF